MALSTIPTRALSEQGINFRNLIINGDMSIAQRGTSVSSLSSSNGYQTNDRWFVRNNGVGAFTLSQDSDVPSGQGFGYSMKWNCTTADSSLASSDFLYIAQRIEGQNLQHLKYGTSNAETMTLSFWVKSTVTGNAVVGLYSADSGKDQRFLYTINSSNTWEKKTIQFSGNTSDAFDNDNNQSLQLLFQLCAGSDRTSGSLHNTWTTSTTASEAGGHTLNIASSTSNTFYLTGVQLEVGTSASDFEFLPYDVNLQRCQRYLQKGYSSADNAVHAGRGQGTTAVDFGFSLVTPLRASPTITQSGSGWRVYKPSATLSDSSDTATVSKFYELNPYITLRSSGHSGITDNYLFGISPNGLTYFFDSEL